MKNEMRVQKKAPASLVFYERSFNHE